MKQLYIKKFILKRGKGNHEENIKNKWDVIEFDLCFEKGINFFNISLKIIIYVRLLWREKYDRGLL